jgi:hypothetical protein
MLRLLGGMLWILGTAFIFYMLLWRLWLLDTVEFVIGLLGTLLLMAGINAAWVWKAGQVREAERLVERQAAQGARRGALP